MAGQPDLSAWRRGQHAKVLGHRGARRDAPENSMLAFRTALQQGAAGVEFDVRLGKEGLVIVLHDADLKRVTEGRDQRRAETLGDAELSSTDLGGGEPVPSLLDVLTWAKETGALLNIELKADVSDPRALVWGTVSALITTDIAKEQCLFSSFDLPILRALAKALPQVPRGWLFDSTWRGWGPVVNAAQCQAVHPRHSLVTAKRVQSWREQVTLINTWTVNDPDQAKALDDLGVDTIISDVPALILQALKPSAS
ncbi:MAG TPA: glycerophosphodiester phosphodiesterase family protein [Polyangiaceae bacterium]|nr:glycerophosphodiester phosphodiesterase family protein [Polyangiaceae bacterium]